MLPTFAAFARNHIKARCDGSFWQRSQPCMPCLCSAGDAALAICSRDGLSWPANAHGSVSPIMLDPLEPLQSAVSCSSCIMQMHAQRQPDNNHSPCHHALSS